CTLDTWRTSGTCGLSYKIPEFGVNLNFAAWKCNSGSNPSSLLPAFKVTCSGPGCATFLAPCDTSAACASPQTCFNVIAQKDEAGYVELARSLLGVSTGNTKCYNDGSSDPLKDVVAALMTLLRSFWDSKRVGNIGFCGLSRLVADTPKAFTDAALTLGYETLKKETCYGEKYKTKVALSSLVAWDGKNAGVSQYRTPAVTKFKPVVVQPNRANIFGWTCDATAELGPAGTLRFKMNQDFLPTLETLATIYRTLANCVGTLSLQQFLTRYGIWSPNPFMYIYDYLAARSTNLGPAQFDTMDLLHQVIFPLYADENGVPKFPVITNIPTTCTFARWITNGRCDFRFTGLTTLLKTDTNIDVRVARCPSTPSQTSLSISCTGAGCSLFGSAPTFCNTNASCKTKTVCENLALQLSFPMDDNDTYPAKSDLIGRFLLPKGSRTMTNVCSVFTPPFAGVDLTCGGNQQFFREIHAMLETLGVKQGIGMPPEKNSANLKVCIPALQSILMDTDKLTQWAMAQLVAGKNGKFSIPGLSPLV
ncbi:hypothetical protein BJ742DRAFT_81342, partial [Cladochytrium replicatum]